MRTSFAFVTIFVVAQAAAGFISIRQSATSSSQCESTCASANATFTSCLSQGGPGPCVCNEGFVNTLMNCFLCTNSLEGSTDFSADQTQLDDLVSTCDALGSPLPIVTLPGQDPNRSIDTSALPSVTFPATSPTGASSGNSPASATSPSASGGAGSASSSAGNSSPSGMQSTPSPVGPSDRVFPSSTSPLTTSTATSPSGSSPTSTNSAAVGNSNSPSSTSASSSPSTSSAAPTTSPTSGASVFKEMSWVSTVFVGAGLILLL